MPPAPRVAKHDTKTSGWFRVECDNTAVVAALNFTVIPGHDLNADATGTILYCVTFSIQAHCMSYPRPTQ